MGDHELWENYHRTNDPGLKEQLVLKYLGLVKYVAGRLMINVGSVMAQEDLEGFGVIGLLDAINRYQHDLGIPFKNYAYTRIRGAMLDEIRKQNWVPRGKWQRFNELKLARQKLRQLGQEPHEQLLADELGLDVSKIRQLMGEYQTAYFVSLDENTGHDNQPGLNNLLSDPQSPDPLELLVEKNTKTDLINAIASLSTRDQLILSLYYQDELTLKEIGRVLELTESRVCQLHAGAIKKLRQLLE